MFRNTQIHSCDQFIAIVYATEVIRQRRYLLTFLFIGIVRVTIYTTVIHHWTNGRTITPPGIFTISKPPNVDQVLNMFHWGLWIIIPTFISIIQPCWNDWIWNSQHKLTVISNASPKSVSEGEVLSNVVFNPDGMQPINHQSWHRHWCELFSSYLELSFQIIKLVGPL